MSIAKRLRRVCKPGPRPFDGTGKALEGGTVVNLGPTELIIILAIVLLLFGGKKLPNLARSLGKSSKEFKKGMTEGASEEDDSEVQA
jgi:sec-independent protein translocase protein TatA